MPQLLVLSILFTTITCSVNKLNPYQQFEENYEPPSSIEYPFGDEMYNDYDYREWKHLEKASDYILPIRSEEEIQKCKEEVSDKLKPKQREYVEEPYEQNECSKCDVRPLLDKKAVVVECYFCSGFEDRVKRRGRYANRVNYRNLTYLVQHLALSDYKFSGNKTVHV